MPKTPRKMKVEQIDFVASSLRTRLLPLSTFADLHLTLFINSTDAAATMTFDEFLMNFITKVSVLLNGQDTLVSVPFYFLYYMNLYEYGVVPYTFYDTAAAADQTKKVSVILPFAMLNAVNPQDTLLDARRLTSCVLEVSFGATPAEITSVEAGHLSINTSEYSNVSDDSLFSRHEYGWDQKPFTSAGVQTVNLDCQSNNQYRRLWVFAWDDTTPPARVDDAISNIEVWSRSFHFLNYEAAHLQFRNQLEYGLIDPATTTYNPVAADTVHKGFATGMYVIDFPTFGLMSQRADARLLTELKLTVTAANATDYIDVIKEKAIFK